MRNTTENTSMLEAKILAREWFYQFKLPSGRVTRSYLPEEVQSIHRTREDMLFRYLEERLEGHWKAMRCLDLGCHEGYFALQLAHRGCREVFGIDARQEHITSANLIRNVYRLENLRFRQANLLELTATDLGTFDIVVMFGILYHLPDVVGAIRIARHLTQGICFVETQVAPELPDQLEWGSKMWTKEIKGSFAIVDESEELATANMEAGVTPISLVPSRKGLLWLLSRSGFGRIELVQPPDNSNEQFARGKRIMVAAEVITRS
jgi:tRNA (mo5U34)-methyltransferase